MRGLFLFIWAGVFVATALPVAACTRNWDPQSGLSQDWPEADRALWYRTSQGSRLIPLDWYQNLPLADGSAPFAARQTQERYATQFCDDSDLPLGFVVDQDPGRAPALGLTCAACHTGYLTDGQHDFVVEGGASELDLQSYMADMFAGVDAVFRDGGVSPGPLWTGFANGVLGPDHRAEDAAQLQADMAHWLQRRYQIQQSIEAGGTWGHGRTDAVQVILNTASVLSGTRAGAALPPSTAPVSTPHVWNAPKMQRVQWNGSASKVKDFGIYKSMELGAMVRNVAEVLGVFAEIDLTTDRVNDVASYPSLTSSVRMANIVRLERSMETLKSPAWPDEWGAVDRGAALYQQGEALFDRHCVACHSKLDRNDLTTIIHDALPGAQAAGPVTRHFAAFDMDNPGAPALNTDPMMTCNAQTHTSWSGKFRVLHHTFEMLRKLSRSNDLSALRPDKFPEGTVTLSLIEELSIRMIFEKRAELVALQGEDMEEAAREAISSFMSGVFGSDPGRKVDPASVPDVPIQGTHGLQTVAEVRESCAAFLKDMAKDQPPIVPEYKARPLNGIFASPPYLHNGSVPTLDDLLKPSSQRPDQFMVGSVLYDTRKLGLGAPRGYGPVGAYRVRDDAGRIIPGNSNEGHDYPAVPLSDQERAAILEYLKGQ